MDYDSQVLYWADYSLNRIESSHTDGSNRQVVISSGVYYPYSLTFYNNTLYWTDDRAIKAASLNNPNVVSVITYGSPYPSYRKYGIKVVTKERQPLSELFYRNYCSQQCYHF